MSTSRAAVDPRPRGLRGSVRPAVTLILNEDVDLLEVHLAEIVLAYIERLEERGELDLEAATEFLILIAALLELKSRLMLPSEEEEGFDMDPSEAAEELLARLLEYRKFRAAVGVDARALRGRAAAIATAPRRCRPSCAAWRSRPRARHTSPSGWPTRCAACCARRRRSTPAT